MHANFNSYTSNGYHHPWEPACTIWDMIKLHEVQQEECCLGLALNETPSLAGRLGCPVVDK
jgi:hypothetical protein